MKNTSNLQNGHELIYSWPTPLISQFRIEIHRVGGMTFDGIIDGTVIIKGAASMKQVKEALMKKVEELLYIEARVTTTLLGHNIEKSIFYEDVK